MDKALLAWKSSRSRMPLVVRGARQVGKTYSVEQFGRVAFDGVVTVDLERNRDAHRVFSGSLAADDVLAGLEIFTGQRIRPGSALLFLDEVQACPRAITALRYLYEERPDLHVIAAGSLMEFALQEEALSFPVGRVQFLDMYPMTFVEYLWAIGNELSADVVLGGPRLLSKAIHDTLLDELRTYCFVGGMPRSVLAWVHTHSFHETFGVHRDICESYREDLSKHASTVDPRCLESVLQDVAQNVGAQLFYSRLAEGYPRRHITRAFDTLCKARVTRRVPSANPSGLPLGASASGRRFKAILLDVGLWQYLCGIRADVEYAKGSLLDVYRGAMAEQFVGQEALVSQGGELHYWARAAKSSSAEVDYLVVIDGSIHPVEVKSGTPGKLRSIKLLLDSYPNCPGGLVLSSAPYAEFPKHRLKYVPLYYAYSATRRSPRQ